MNEHLNKDSVAAAFKLVMEELDKSNQEITKQITQASMNADFEKAQVLVDRGKSLKAFQTRVNALRQEWIDGIDIRAGFPNKPQPKSMQKRAVAPPSRLRVSFPDGKVIEETFAADTFAKAIQAMGVNKVRHMNLRMKGIPLIDSVKRDKKCGQREIQGQYICTWAMTSEKKELLDKIARQLRIRLKVEIISKDKSALF